MPRLTIRHGSQNVHEILSRNTKNCSKIKYRIKISHLVHGGKLFPLDFLGETSSLKYHWSEKVKIFSFLWYDHLKWGKKSAKHTSKLMCKYLKNFTEFSLQMIWFILFLVCLTIIMNCSKPMKLDISGKGSVISTPHIRHTQLFKPHKNNTSKISCMS